MITSFTCSRKLTQMYNINSSHHTITCFLLSLFDKSFYELLYPCLRYISCFLHQKFQGSTFFNSIWHNLNALFHFLRIVDCFLQFNMSLCTLTLFYVSCYKWRQKKIFDFILLISFPPPSRIYIFTVSYITGNNNARCVSSF